MPGIWAPKRARIPAQENRRGGPRPSQKTGRLLLHFSPGNLTSSTALLMLGPPPCCRYLGGHIQAFFPTADRFFECCRGTVICKWQSCGNGTHGNSTSSPKTSPIFWVCFADRFFNTLSYSAVLCLCKNTSLLLQQFCESPRIQDVACC